MRGFVYIITNPSYKDGIIKIGYSRKDPRERAEELSKNTGIPERMVLEYDILIEDPETVEREIHMLLSKFNRDKEWFNYSVINGIQLIRKYYGQSILAEYDPMGHCQKLDIIDAGLNKGTEITKKPRFSISKFINHKDKTIHTQPPKSLSDFPKIDITCRNCRTKFTAPEHNLVCPNCLINNN
jgi:hypothetical protein